MYIFIKSTVNLYHQPVCIWYWWFNCIALHDTALLYSFLCLWRPRTNTSWFMINEQLNHPLVLVLVSCTSKAATGQLEFTSFTGVPGVLFQETNPKRLESGARVIYEHFYCWFRNKVLSDEGATNYITKCAKGVLVQNIAPKKKTRTEDIKNSDTWLFYLFNNGQVNPTASHIPHFCCAQIWLARHPGHVRVLMAARADMNASDSAGWKDVLFWWPTNPWKD